MKKSIQLTLTAAVFTIINFLSNHQALAQNVFIPDANFKAILVANSAINTDANTEISYAEAYAYTGTINAPGAGISNLTGIEAFSAATRLNCAFNSLTTLDLSYNVSLTYVDCSSNSLTTLNVYNVTNLDTLDCSANNLICLDLHTNPNLARLNCGSNNLTSLNLKSGNNAALNYMSAFGAGGMLYCIQVDNAAVASSEPSWFEDTWSVYNGSCGTAVTASYTHDAPVCFGSAVTFTDASTGFIDYWHWDFGDGTSSNTQNSTHAFGGGAYYWVTLVAGNCNKSDTIGATVAQGNDIYGQATYSGGDVSSGTAVLMPLVGSYEMLDTMYTSSLDPSGFYSFPHVLDGNYIIKVFPDTILFPTLIPTYYANDWLWDSATVHNQPCNMWSIADVYMSEIISGIPGTGSASGLVIQGIGFGRAQGDPIHGVDVKLGITGTSNIVASTETDTNGLYVFPALANGNYTVFVDIPGLLRDSTYSFTIDASNQDFNDLHYWVDSTMIYIAPGIGIENIDDPTLQSLIVYPNPVNDISSIRFNMVNSGHAKLELQNIYGIKLQTLMDEKLDNGEYIHTLNPVNLPAGTYFITLTVNGKTRTIRTIVMK